LTVADVAVATRAVVRQRMVTAPVDGMAVVRAARVVVVAVERNAELADGGMARLQAVADVTVAAGRVVRQRYSRSADGGLTGLRAIAGVAVRARRPVDERVAGLTLPRGAKFRAVARIAVGTARAVVDRGVRASGLRVARIARARVAVDAVE